MDMYITDDGSRTFRNKEVDQLYHTKGGAIVEALEKHARALKVWEKDTPVIFDVCSGLSYSAACALEEIRRHGNDSLVTIYLFENDRVILEKNLELADSIDYMQDGKSDSIACYQHFKDAIHDFLKSSKTVYTSRKDNVKIIIVFGDVQSTIDTVEQDADFLFYAPFSPVATPDMWDISLLRKLYAHTAPRGKLSTYSYARKVRDGLSNAGFQVIDGPILARRSPSIVAIRPLGINDKK